MNFCKGIGNRPVKDRFRISSLRWIQKGRHRIRNTYHDEVWRKGAFRPPPTDHVVRQRLHLRLRDPLPVRVESSRVAECVVGRGSEVGGGDGGRVHVAFQVEVEEFKHERERLVAVDDVEEPEGCRVFGVRD